MSIDEVYNSIYQRTLKSLKSQKETSYFTYVPPSTLYDSIYDYFSNITSGIDSTAQAIIMNTIRYKPNNLYQVFR